ncbi:MAG: hypothetical protein CMJ48_00065 [Planctomycetaceae bacterium]|nr:hypothetical protein [Planctomycetaceae bacterium]
MYAHNRGAQPCTRGHPQGSVQPSGNKAPDSPVPAEVVTPRFLLLLVEFSRLWLQTGLHGSLEQSSFTARSRFDPNEEDFAWFWHATCGECPHQRTTVVGDSGIDRRPPEFLSYGCRGTRSFRGSEVH